MCDGCCARLEDEGLEVIDQGREDVGDARDNIGHDLVEFELLNDAVVVRVEDSKEGDDNVLEAIAHRQILVRGVAHLDEYVHEGNDFVLRDVSIPISICQKQLFDSKHAEHVSRRIFSRVYSSQRILSICI